MTILRYPRPADVAAILDLIKELAVYDREPDAVECTETVLSALLFDEPAQLEAFVADLDGDVVGLALWFRGFSTWTGKPTIYLEDFVVRDEMRSNGVGRALFAALASEAEARGCGRIDWAVVDLKEAAQRSYASVGAAPQAVWRPWRLDKEAIQLLATGDEVGEARRVVG